MKDTTCYTMKNLPKHGFWHQVKVLALARHTTIKQMIIDLLKKEIKKQS